MRGEHNEYSEHDEVPQAPQEVTILIDDEILRGAVV